MNLKILLEGIRYQVLQGKPECCSISGLCEDSRRIKRGDLFFCRKGEHANGNAYLRQALLLGAAAVVSDAYDDRDLALLEESGVCVIQTQAQTGTQAALASNYYQSPQQKLCCVGVTGTKGKTTVCAMLNKILTDNGYRCALAGTNGFVIGEHKEKNRHTTPELFELYAFLAEAVKEGCTHCILEVSSLAVKQGRIDGLEFELGIFTNLSSDHVAEGEHQSFEEYAEWKRRFFDCCRSCLLNLDEPFSVSIQKAQGESKPCFWYSISREADGYASQIRREPVNKSLGQHFLWHWKQDAPVQIHMSMPGRYNVSNAAAALSAGQLLVPAQPIQIELTDFHVQGRFQIAGTYHGGLVVIDYAHNEASLEKLLKAAAEYHPSHLICLFGCGGGRSSLRRSGMGRVSTAYADLTVITQDNSREEPFETILSDILSGVIPGSSYVVIYDRKEAICYSMDRMQPGDILLLAGKGHENTQEINGKNMAFSEKEIVEQHIRKGEHFD